MAVATDTHYLFLMRHAEHSEGQLTAKGSEHVRQVATRLGVVQAEWRSEPHRRIRLWYTTPAASEVQETVDLLTLGMSEVVGLNGQPYERFAAHPEVDAPASDSPQGGSMRRQRWMARQLPGRARSSALVRGHHVRHPGAIPLDGYPLDHDSFDPSSSVAPTSVAM